MRSKLEASTGTNIALEAQFLLSFNRVSIPTVVRPADANKLSQRTSTSLRNKDGRSPDDGKKVVNHEPRSTFPSVEWLRTRVSNVSFGLGDH